MDVIDFTLCSSMSPNEMQELQDCLLDTSGLCLVCRACGEKQTSVASVCAKADDGNDAKVLLPGALCHQ